MPLVEDDNVVRTITANTSNNSFHIRILPGASRCGDDFFDEEALHTTAKSLAIGGVSIAKQILRCGIPREGLDHLLSHPLRRRMRRDIEINQFSTVMRKDYENVEHSEIDRRDDEKVDGDQVR